MSGHLNDEQFTRYLLGEEDARAQSHLGECPECRQQAARLLEVVGTSRAHAEQSGDRHANFWALQRNEVRYALAIRRPQRPTWAVAAAMAMLVFFSTFMFQSQETRPQLGHEGPTVTSPTIVNDDEALLSAVNSALDQDVPAALVPVQRLAYEREQAEQNRTGQN